LYYCVFYDNIDVTILRKDDK